MKESTSLVLKIAAVISLPILVKAIWTMHQDPNLSAIESFLESDMQLRDKVGNVSNLSLKGSTIYFRPAGVGAAKEPDRIRYRYFVNGENGIAQVKVMVHISDADEIERIEIENIE